MLFRSTSLVSSTGHVDVVLLPTSSSDPTDGSAPAQSPAPVYATFDATFDQVTTSAVSAISSPSPASQGTGTSGLPGPFAPSVVNAGSPSSYPGVVSPLGTLLNPVPPAGTPPALAVPSVPAAPAATGPRQVPQAFTPAVSVGRSWRQRVLLSLILIDLVAYLMWSASRASAGGLARLSIYEIPGRTARRRPRPGAPPALR